MAQVRRRAIKAEAQLERLILSAFKQALAAGRPDVAEHLFQALEAVEPDCPPGASLADTYLSRVPRLPHQ